MVFIEAAMREVNWIKYFILVLAAILVAVDLCLLASLMDNDELSDFSLILKSCPLAFVVFLCVFVLLSVILCVFISVVVFSAFIG